ncbi:MAG TPA: transposase [Chitinophagales bacterium]|nr:transposase [Chitinophagales bacterium]
MEGKFQNKYRISSARLQTWDYRWSGAYFITICTKNREHYFGEIVNQKMILSNVGVLANVFWCEIKNHTKNVTLGEFVVMPNHIHGILILNDNVLENVSASVETLHATSLQIPLPPQSTTKNEQMTGISPKSGSISAIIRSYKSAVTKHANRLGFDFAWQPRFHDHIIRDEQSFDNIQNYIFNNPINWEIDKFYKKE